MSKKFQTVLETKGYVTKPDPTNTDARFLVKGSQNMLINDEEKVGTRKGYTLKGAASAVLNPIESSFDWETSLNTILNLRGEDGTLAVFLGTVDGVEIDAWTDVVTGFADAGFVFAPWWDTSENIDILLFVVGTDDLYNWSGGVATLASATATTLVKNGTSTWAENRFLSTGTRKVIINGTVYTYTGGEGTTTLTGVTPSPAAEAADSIVTQEIRTDANTPAANFLSDVIHVQDNQVYIGSNSSQEVFVSKNTSFTDYSFSSPRVPGEGELLVLDKPCNAIRGLRDKVIIFSGRDDIYTNEFAQLDVSGTLTETLKIKKLKTTTGQAAQSQALTGNFGDSLAFVTFEPALRILEDVANIAEPQIRNFSNPIKPDFDAEDFTNGDMLFDKQRIHIATPVNGKMYILEFKEDSDGNIVRFWQPPQILAMRTLSIIDGALHGHSSAVTESYKLFDGDNDLGNSFRAVAAFAYNTYRERINMKSFDEYYTEGFISANTKIKLILNYDFDGFTQTIEKTIDGSDSDIIFNSLSLGSLGDSRLGDIPLGGEAGSEDEALPKFRIIHEIPRQDFFEMQAIYEIDDVDERFQILSHGPNALLSKNMPTQIKK